MSRELSNYAALMIPWEDKIKNIESYFGSVVASYFTFLRWLFWINFIMALICGVVIIMPEVLFGPDMGAVPYKSVPVNESTEASYLKTLWNFNGYAQVSPIFYGYYSSIKVYESGFRMPFAYLLGNLMMFGYSFITILKQMAANSKDEKATDKDDNFTFSWKAFASWDYMIGNEETAKNKYKALVITIRESVTESKESAKKTSKKVKFFRFVANILVLMVLTASTYAIYITVNRSRKFQALAKEKGPSSVTWVQSNEVSLVMSLVTAFCPMIFDVIANLEDYHPRVALQWSLRRIMVLYLLNLYTLYIALYWKIQDIEKEALEANSTFYANLNMSEIIPCSTPLPIISDSFSISILHEGFANQTSMPCGIPEFVPEMTCWETMVGQELIKLTVFDFVTTVGLIYVTEFFRAVFIRVLNACWCWDMEIYFPAYAEFSLADNLLHLVYNQGMIWMGTLFCPGLPALNLFKLLCLFYVRAWAVMVCNVPHERIFKAGSNNFYLMLLLFMLYVVMIPIAFAMVSIRPSRTCGPYQDTEYMYLIITEWVQDVFHETIFAVLKYLTSPGALIPIFILLLLCIYYLSSSNDALQGTVLDLKKQLQYERTEGKKKVFNMNKAKEEASPNEPPSVPEVKIATQPPKEQVTIEKEVPTPSIASVLLAKKYISKTRERIEERKLAATSN
ncbi:transmembrane channel-like protein 3 [Watersipora subatra]|uniref:transmembrane channel-like protein 3 n=1 Tax=Watersipora subatra TaxID=2589382 RepID=UPI00355B22DA